MFTLGLIALTCSGAVLLGSTTMPVQRAKVLSAGQTVPSAVLQDLDGSQANLRALIGKKPVLIEFWATWCGVCKALKPRLEAARAKYADRVDVIVVAVSMDQTRQEVLDHLKTQTLPGRVLYDAAGEAMAGFGVAGTGYVFVMNTEGRVTYAGAGPTQDLDAAIASALR